MPRFMVTAVMETDLYCVVEAKDEREAREKAFELARDGALLEEENGGSLRICEAFETEEQIS